MTTGSQCRGFTLPTAEVPVDFRGPGMPSFVGAAAIGCAGLELRRDPAAFAERGTYAEVPQELKLLCHVLVRFGHPRANAGSAG